MSMSSRNLEREIAIPATPELKPSRAISTLPSASADKASAQPKFLQ